MQYFSLPEWKGGRWMFRMSWGGQLLGENLESDVQFRHVPFLAITTSTLLPVTLFTVLENY